MERWRSMVIYLAQMQDIPKTLYESADIDGAGWFRKLFKITLPFMTPAIFLQFITGIIGSFQVFTIAYIVTPGGSPGRSTYYYAYYLYDKMMSDNAMGMYFSNGLDTFCNNISYHSYST